MRSTFTSVALTAAAEDVLYEYSITVADVDADDPATDLAITATTKPDWLTLADNGDGTATLTGTPDNDDVGDHAVTLRVADDGGAFSEQIFTVTVAEDRTISIALDIQPCWNLLSLPFDLSPDSLVPNVLADESGTALVVESCYAWDSEEQEYVSFDSGFVGGEGFWAMGECDSITATATISSDAVPDGALVLNVGWNLVGPISECLVPVDEVITAIWWWNAETLRYVALGDDDVLAPGVGYWIYVTEECVIETGE